MKLVYRCLCVVLGAILGAGCSSNSADPVEYGPMPEYGVPSGTIRLDGRVLDQVGAPIPGIVVAFNDAPADTTDARGTWSIEREHTYIPCAGSTTTVCTVTAEDIDGAANGGPYPPVEMPLDLVQTEPGSGAFDQGTWEQHGLDIEMSDAVEYGPPIARLPTPVDPAR